MNKTINKKNINNRGCGHHIFFLSSVVSAQNEKTEAEVVFKSGSNITTILQHFKNKKSPKDQTYAMKKYVEPLIRNVKGTKTKSML